MRKIIFILATSFVLMLSCSDTLYELNYVYDCGCDWEHEYAPIITPNSPFSWTNDIPALRTSASTHKQMSALDMEKIFREDLEDEVRGVPPRFGYKHSVHYTLENTGEWIELPDGSRLWRLTISSPGALAISLLYDQFWLPDGAKFWVYSTDRRHSTDVITSAYNIGTRDDIQGFATGLVYGDQITLEYFLPSCADEVGVVSIAYVVHGYRHIRPSGIATRDARFELSLWCQINVNHPDGAPWRNERNAVVRINMGNRFCTGFLINNTANNRRPLLITADHCIICGRDARDDNSPVLPWRFYWHFESPNRENNLPATRPATVGAKLIANNPLSDFALLDLSGAGNPNNRTDIIPYFLGWDRSNNPARASGVGIHHPQGDIKKINFFTQQVQSEAGQITGEPHTFWRVIWSREFTQHSGLTEGGSSGSPLINNNRRVIGQLYGSFRGQDCNTRNPTSFYGRFDVSWTGTTTGIPHPYRERRLGYWLAPGRENNAPLTMCSSPPTIRSINVPSGITTGVTLFFTVDHSGGETFTWSVSPAQGHSGGGGGHTLPISFHLPGVYTITATVTNACGTNTMSMPIMVLNHRPPITCIYCNTPSNFPPGCRNCPPFGIFPDHPLEEEEEEEEEDDDDEQQEE